MADAAVAKPTLPGPQLGSPRNTRGRRNDGASNRSRSPARQRKGERERDREREPKQPRSILGIAPADRQEVPTKEEEGDFFDDKDDKYYSSSGDDEDIDMEEAPAGTFHADPAREAHLKATAEGPERPPKMVMNINSLGLEWLKTTWGTPASLTEQDELILGRVQDQVVTWCRTTPDMQDLNDGERLFKADSWAIPASDIKGFGYQQREFFKTYKAAEGNEEEQTKLKTQLRHERAKLDRILDARGIKEGQICPEEDIAYMNKILGLPLDYQGTTDAPVASTNALVSGAPSNSADVGPSAVVGPSSDAMVDSSSNAVNPLAPTDVALPDIHNNILGKREMIRKAGGRGYRVIVNRGTDASPLYQVRPSSDWGTASDFEEDEDLQIDNPLDRGEIAQLKKSMRKTTVRAMVQEAGNSTSVRTPPTYILIVGRPGTELDGWSRWITKTEFFACKGSGKTIKGVIRSRVQDYNVKVAQYRELLTSKIHPDTKAPLTKADIQGEVGERLTWLLDGEDLPDLETLPEDCAEPSTAKSRPKKKGKARVAQPNKIGDAAETGERE